MGEADGERQGQAPDGLTDGRCYSILVVGASAGGVEALSRFVSGLPPELPLPIAITLHVNSTTPSVLAEILSRAGELSARRAEDGDRLVPGQIYVAPPDHHLLVGPTSVRLSRGPRENGHRPAIDPLFRSAARAHGPGAIGLVLSGMLDDGAAGLAFLRSAGGATLVQDPDDAMYRSMPDHAISATHVDRIAPVSDMPAILSELVQNPPLGRGAASTGSHDDLDLVEVDTSYTDVVAGPPSGLTCPECGGALWEQPGDVLRFTCQVGHSYSTESLLESQGESLEGALWSAVRALQERSDLSRRIARRSAGRTRERMEAQAREADNHASQIQDVLNDSDRVTLGDAEITDGG